MNSAPLTAAEYEALSLLEGLEGADSVLDAVVEFNPKFSRPTHLRELANLFCRAERERVRAAVSVPPRHGKTCTLQAGIVWFLRRHPDLTVGYASYATDIARRKSRQIRDMAIRAGIRLRSDTHNVGEWRTKAGGGLLAAGPDGQWTGEGIHLFVMDDMSKDRFEAASPVMQARNIDFLHGTAMSRIEPGGSAILNMARWTPTDLIGHVTNLPDTDWEYLNLPAINERGEALWPERWPVEALNSKRQHDVHEFEWAALYMGNPRARGSVLFSREPARYDRPDIDGAQIFVACDPAITAKTSADTTAIIVGAGKLVDGRLRVDILEVATLQGEMEAICQELRSISLRWGAKIGIEAVGGFKGVSQTLRMIDPKLRVIDITPKEEGNAAWGDKHVRAVPAATAWNDGRIRLPSHDIAPIISMRWVTPFIYEVKQFTGTRDIHDDQVDALAHLHNVLEYQLRPQIPRAAARVHGVM